MEAQAGNDETGVGVWSQWTSGWVGQGRRRGNVTWRGDGGSEGRERSSMVKVGLRFHRRRKSADAVLARLAAAGAQKQSSALHSERRARYTFPLRSPTTHFPFLFCHISLAFLRLATLQLPLFRA